MSEGVRPLFEITNSDNQQKDNEMKCKNHFLAFFVLVAMAGGFAYASSVPLGMDEQTADPQTSTLAGNDSIDVDGTTNVLAGGLVHVNDDLGLPVVTAESFEHISASSGYLYLFEVGWRS